MTESNQTAKRIIAVDSVGGLLVGCLTLALASLISKWYGWSEPFTYYMATVNLVYGTYSGILWLSGRSSLSFSRTPIILLIIVNSIWGGHCFTQAYYQFDSLTVIGLIVLCGEGLYVAGLGFIEALIVLPRTT